VGKIMAEHFCSTRVFLLFIKIFSALSGQHIMYLIKQCKQEQNNYWEYFVVLKRTVLLSANCKSNLLGAGVLGNSLGSFRDGVFGQFSGEEEPDGGLDLPGSDGGPLVVVGQFGSLGSDTLEEIVDEGVHDAHGLG
jgi:hypothetical protein